MTIVVRPRPRDRDKPEFFTERMLDWPADAVSASREGRNGRWRFRAVADVLREKRERMEASLRGKRRSGVVSRRAVFIWSFWTPGIYGGFFMGWWLYLRGIGGRTIPAGGNKGSIGPDLMRRVRELFPVPGGQTLFGPIGKEDYAEAFALAYARGTHCGRPQGLAICWARIDEWGYVMDIERADNMPLFGKGE